MIPVHVSASRKERYLEEEKTFDSIFLKYEEELRQLYRFREFKAIDRKYYGFENPSLVLAICYLIDRFKTKSPQNWKGQFEALLELYRECYRNDDFIPAAEFYYRIRVEHLEEMKNNPNHYRPGGGHWEPFSIDFLLTYEWGHVDALHKMKKQGKPITINAISSPPLEDQSDWSVALTQSGCSIEEIIAWLDTQKPGQ
jgi:hypothetical protein